MDIINKIKNLTDAGNGIKATARKLDISKNTVRKYLDIISCNSLKNSEELLYENDADKIYSQHYIHNNDRKEFLIEFFKENLFELSKVGVTREHLWDSYLLSFPNGYSYGEFCRQLKSYRRTLDSTLNFVHKAAQTMQVDFAGKKLKYFNEDLKELFAEVLICVLPYSGHCFAIALPSQNIENFTYGISQALHYFGGSPQIVLSDNLKSYVTKPDRYNPTFTQAVSQLKSHYGFDLDATRVAKPKDKASVERHVTIVYQNIFSKLHKEKSLGIEALNLLVLKHLNTLNNNPSKEGQSRVQKFESSEKEHLIPLPSKPFLITKTIKAAVQRNYHVLLGEDNHYYSVPYKYIGQKVDVVYTKLDVEIFVGVRRIAYHKRDNSNNNFSTNENHRPEKHNIYIAHINSSPEDYQNKAAQIGENTAWAMKYLLDASTHRNITFKSADGLLSLARNYTNERVEQICTYIKPCGVITLDMIKNIINSKIDKAENNIDQHIIPLHENIRGGSNYK